ncbi:hypothetical protein, partial [Micromonospora sp. KC207]|uniref:hypothetical protein n=1 Tax=Micromonospora sp. KC207 TaxID=2530377 RepID=UPI001A9DB8F3
LMWCPFHDGGQLSTPIVVASIPAEGAPKTGPATVDCRTALLTSSIDHAVRSAVLPRAVELEQARASLHSDSKSACVIAARAVHKRMELTEARYRVLLDPFTAAGVPVPDRDNLQGHGGTPC